MGEIFGFDAKWRLALHWTLASPALTRSALRVLLLLVQHCNPKTRRCDPSMARLAKTLGLSRRSVVNAINELRARGAIVVGTTGPRSSNQYNFPEPGDAHMPAVSSVNPASAHGEARFPKHAKDASQEKKKEKIKKKAEPQPKLGRLNQLRLCKEKKEEKGTARHHKRFLDAVLRKLEHLGLSEADLIAVDSGILEGAYQAHCEGTTTRAAAIEMIVESCLEIAGRRA